MLGGLSTFVIVVESEVSFEALSLHHIYILFDHTDSIALLTVAVTFVLAVAAVQFCTTLSHQDHLQTLYNQSSQHFNVTTLF
ncbi:MAG: hypothetical protein ACOZBL_03365 [Patescibacteria group bacterium]